MKQFSALQQRKNGVMVECNKQITLSKPIQWKVSEATWRFQVPFSSIEFQDLNNFTDDAVFDIGGWVVNVSDKFEEGGIEKRRLLIERGDTTVTMDLLGRHASMECKPGDSLAGKGVILNSFQGDRTVTTKRMSLVRVNPEDTQGLPSRLTESSPRKRALKMVSENVLTVIELKAQQEEMVKEGTKAANADESPSLLNDEKAKPGEVRCSVKAHFGTVDNNLFDENIVKSENPPRFLVTTNIEDETGSIPYVKIWTNALCAMLNRTPAQLLSSWQACSDPEQREEFLDQLNEGLQKSSQCLVAILPWYKTSGGSGSTTLVAQIHVNNAEPCATE